MESMKVADYMTTEFVKFNPNALVVEAVRDLLKHEAIGGPVISASGELVGWISEQDCMSSALQVLYYNQRVAQVADVMKTEVLTVLEDDDLLSLAQQMLKQKPKAYPVLDDDGRVIGIISRRLILRAIDKQLLAISAESPIKQPHEAHLG
ncbi:CBS domain-containing protein [Halioxenophilus sp. WMMB6]|uniref:CBS domain-containing protein n=1 Tax=Halioxenophilus sp. WMMB6 TaxID=3073815 RepID=UPI00295F3CB4|nr:CBS domain-containing protein [Halioxenophilus sp. WMMB6]